jgi:hypothetical protein
MQEPRNQYIEYTKSLAETGDLDSLMSYEEWLEEELDEMWSEYGTPYLTGGESQYNDR